MKLTISNSDVFKAHIYYLVHLISRDSILPFPEILKTMPLPRTNIKELRQFPRLTGYNRNHINHYADITQCLAEPLKQNNPYHCSRQCETPFPGLKIKYKYIFNVQQYWPTLALKKNTSFSMMPSNIVG